MRREKKPKRRVRWLRLVVLSALAVLVLFTLTGAVFVWNSYRTMPTADVNQINPAQTSVVLDIKGREISKLHGIEDRTIVPFDRIPKHVQDAFVAVEDAQFWTHRGINVRRTVGAVWNNVLRMLRIGGRRDLQGGSTITQQLATRWFLTKDDKSVRRKIQEWILAIQLERKFTKKEILTEYLNEIPLGHSAYGVQSAAQLYFGKNVGDLTLGEAAMIAGLTKYPNGYSPYRNLEGATKRRAVVLSLMVENEMISQAQADEAKKEEVKLAGLRKEKERASFTGAHMVDYVLDQLLPEDGSKGLIPDLSDSQIYTGGLKIYTTLDLDMQAEAERAVRETLDPVFSMDVTNPTQIGLVFLETKTGYIKVMVGGRRHDAMRELNRATQAVRQPGSTFKPIAAYVPAIEMGYAPSTVVDDAPFMLKEDGKVWPENYDNKFRGLQPFRVGLEWSVNAMAVRVLNLVGVETAYDYAEKMGISTLVPKGRYNDKTASLALGGITKGATVLDMTTAYGVLANGGIRVDPIGILKVEDQRGNVLYKSTPSKKTVLKPTSAYLVTDMLKGVITKGTGRRADIGRPAAGKTGTTTDGKDAWWVGYTPEYAGAVWMGHDEPKKMDWAAGGKYPAMIWAATAKSIYNITKQPATDFPMPPGIVRAPVALKSGKLPGPNTPPDQIYDSIFAEGTVPTEIDNVYVWATVTVEDPTLLHDPNCTNHTPLTRWFIQRPQPYPPDPAGRKPADSVLELPTRYCTDPPLPQQVPGSS